ncbi:MAG: RluA family pseudouridine synthase [Candidatus Azosocius agrarius]|nr:MAG: RluA family pseudouridine synthase [Gammaproteobacteria bacterium]
MQKKFFTKIKLLIISKNNVKQRIDNFLFSYYKILSKKHIQKIIRKGEVRINKKRINNLYYLQLNDIIRIPPIYVIKKKIFFYNNYRFLKKILNNIIYENKLFLIINKPNKISVHDGHNNKNSIIKIMKKIKFNKYVELIHRLDKATSGCLIISKSFTILQKLNYQLKYNKIKKIYHLLCYGIFNKNIYAYTNIYKNFNKNVLKVKNEHNSLTKFNYIKIYTEYSLLEAIPYTGKKHQIRISTKKLNHSIIGDNKYINKNFIKYKKIINYKRLFLHSKKIKFICPLTNKLLIVNAPYDNSLYKILNKK